MYLPNDCNSTERELYNYLTGRPKDYTIDVYKVIPDPIDKFLIAYVFELGNTRKEAEEALGLSKTTIWARLKRVRLELSKHFERI
jgi:hypothetical protein